MLQVPSSTYSTMLLLLIAYLIALIRANPDIGGGTHGGETSHLQVDDPDFSGIVDFSNAIPGPDGSWCITKTKYVDHMVKDQVKECWHENVTQCHDTYVTEFLPSQEQKCEETFWKSCKIDFKEAPYNYTMKQCHTPLVKECDKHPTYSPTKDAEIVCKTWFESECNTTFVETSPNKDDLPNTWCKKVPRKICAPDNCRMVPGPEQCNQKMMVSTIQKPSEVCDLQPQTHCRLITRLVPHLIQKEVCRRVPKEMCHLALANPHLVKKPMRLRWCTKTPPPAKKKPSYKPPTPSYLPPSKRSSSSSSIVTTSSPGLNTGLRPVALASNSPPPSYTTLRPGIQFQRRSHQDAYETKFKPILLKAEPVEEKNPQHILIEDFFVQNSAEDLELITKTHDHVVNHHAEPLVSRNSYQNSKDVKPDHDLQEEHVFHMDDNNDDQEKVAEDDEDKDEKLSDVVESILSKLRSTTEIMEQPFDENYYSSEEDYYNRHDQDYDQHQQDLLYEPAESLKTELLQDEYGAAAGELKGAEPEQQQQANISEMPILPASISDELSGYDTFSSGILDHNIGETVLKKK